jgi:hypothetical protein
MHFFRTRAYVPAKPFWGALTAKLTPQFQLIEYEKIGNFLKKVMRFGYLYISDGDEVFIPQYTEEGLKFGNLSQIGFEKRFISSLASATIESSSFTAEEGMLHEVEFINPYTINDGKPVFLRGLLWVSESSEGGLSVVVEGDNFSIAYNNVQVNFSELIHTLQVGGERKYGFGQLKLKNLEKIDGDDLKDLRFIGKWKEDRNGIKLELEEGDPVWSHVKHASDLKIKGSIEPIVGRDWNSKGVGRKLSTYGLCWAPGSILIEDKTFKITQDFGLWEEE